MPDRLKIMKELIDQKQAKKELRCTLNHKCWCNQLETSLCHTSTKTDCLSPAELLDHASTVLTEKDRIYLEKLSSMDFKLSHEH